jgi:hypothetical protein
MIASDSFTYQMNQTKLPLPSSLLPPSAREVFAEKTAKHSKK